VNELALFAGAGGGLLGSILLGWRTVCAVEIDPECRASLLARQRDGILERFPIWDDVCTFDGRPWRGRVQLVSGGFPCQDISSAGTGKGLDGERSGLWVEMERIIREVEPDSVWLENSPVITTRGLSRVLWDLAAMGFDARWGVFSAGDAGARHERSRFFCAAHRAGFVGSPRPWSIEQFRQPASEPFCNGKDAADSESLWLAMADARAGMDDDVARRVVRTHAIGNGQVPAVVAGAWRVLNGQDGL
jgi:DNA (cytosine-5)-methyltransferase 1